jgi:hypothetical protein
MTTGPDLSAGTGLYALLAAIRNSPIVVRMAGRLAQARDWARIRKSPEVDAYVLAWIAGHVPRNRRTPRRFM